MKKNQLAKATLRGIDLNAVKDSSEFLVRKSQHLAPYKDVEDLGVALAESTPPELKGFEYHFMRIRATLLRSLTARRIFIGGSLLDDLLFQILKRHKKVDVCRSVIRYIFETGIHRPGLVVVPVHSFGIAGFGFFRHFRRTTLMLTIPEAGVVVAPQTNSLRDTLKLIDAAADALGISQKVPHDSIRHYRRSRPTAWLVRNPLLFLRVRGVSGSYYENQRFILARTQIATSLIFLLSVLTSPANGKPGDWFGSTSRINNSETLDIKHYLLFETLGHRRRRLRGTCVPIHVDAAVFAELSNLSVELNLKTLRRRRTSLMKAIRALERLEEKYFKYLFVRDGIPLEGIIYRKIFDALGYFRRSFRISANPGEAIVNLAIAFEVLLTDNYALGVRKRLIKRLSLALRGVPGNRSMKKEVGRLYEARGQIVHNGLNSTEPDMRTAQRAFAHALMGLAQRCGRFRRKTGQPVGTVLGDTAA